MRQHALRTLLAGILVLGLAPGARGGEPPTSPPASPPPEVGGADQALAALEAKDEARLGALAAQDDPDPWLVADELVRRGRFDAAEAFAKAALRPDTEGLPAYVASRRGQPDDPARRERVAAAYAAHVAKRSAEEQIAVLGPREPGPAHDVVGIRLLTTWGTMLAVTGRDAESVEASRAGAEAAETLGWWSRAQRLWGNAGHFGMRLPDATPATEAFQRLLPILERRGQRLEAARARSDLGRMLTRLRRYEEAREALERGLRELETLGDPRARAVASYLLARLHALTGDSRKALPLYEQAEREFTALGMVEDRLLALHGVAKARDVLGDLDGAEAAYGQGVAEAEARGLPGLLGNALRGLGGVQKDRGDYAAAQATLERALVAYEAAGEPVGVAGTWAFLGSTALAQGDYVRARTCVERSLALAEAQGPGAESAMALAMDSLGGVHLKLGDYAEAASQFERAVALYRKLGNELGLAIAQSHLGALQLTIGEHAKALGNLERAHATLERLGDASQALHTLTNIASAHRFMGEYGKALAVMERVLGARRAMGARAEEASDLGAIGGIHMELGDYERARTLLERARSEQQALGDRSGAANTAINLAIVAGRLGDPEAAYAAIEEARAAFEALGEREKLADALQTMGHLHMEQRRLPEALRVLRQALGLYEELGNRRGVIKAQLPLGVTLFKQGDLDAARESLERAVRGARSLRMGQALATGHSALAALHLHRRDAGRALGHARDALAATEGLLGGLAEEEGAFARERVFQVFQLGAAAAAADDDPAQAFVFLESGRAGALLDSLDKRETLRWKAETLPAELQDAERHALAAERQARAAYDRVLGQTDRKARAQAARALDDALEDLRAVNARIQREAKRAAGLFYPRAAALEEVQASLEPDEALVLYGNCIEKFVALVVRTDGERIVDLGPPAELAAAHEAWERASTGDDPDAALAGLRRLLVEPLALGEDVKTVLVSPEGPLCFLPWGALLDRPVALTPSGTTHALLRSEEREPGTGVLALGDPDYAGATSGAGAVHHRGKPLAPLPATRSEVEAVGTVRLLGAEANEAGFREALGKAERWRAVHFACHGLIDARRPGLSALALSRSGDADGLLTASEVLRLPIPADLAMLSACETATGRLVGGEGIVGLTRAFMYAGTPRVICSLWKVDDEATAALMKRFYAIWAPADGAKGLPTAEALRHAQEHVRSQPSWAHPRFWAAWVLWGLPD